jgi:tRNA threonylcarbamoyl adenosine modification protein YeaZ
VAVGATVPLAVSLRTVQHRHGSHLLEQIDEVLASVTATLADLDGLVVGTGPGSFTGLRVGLATLKTVAYARRLPLVGVRSTDALRAASGLRDGVVVLPAGARDHYLARPGQDPLLVAPGDLIEALAGGPAISVDLPAELLGPEAAERGRVALAGLALALLDAARARLAAGDGDDVAELTPAYVALPRGVKRAAEELGWSPDLR